MSRPDASERERERERKCERQGDREASLVDFPRGTRLSSTEHRLRWHARDVAAASASGCSKPTNRTVILSHAVRFVARHGDHHPVSVTAHKTRRSWRDYRSQTESPAFGPYPIPCRIMHASVTRIVASNSDVTCNEWYTVSLVSSGEQPGPGFEPTMLW